MKLDPQDLIIKWFNPNKGSGAWSLDAKKGVTIRHKRFDLKVSYASKNTAAENLSAAMREMELLAAVEERLLATKEPLRVNLADVKKARDSGVIICRLTITNIIDYAIELEQKVAKLERQLATPMTVTVGGGVNGVTYSGSMHGAIGGGSGAAGDHRAISGGGGGQESVYSSTNNK